VPSNSNHQEKQLGIDRISEGLADIVAKVASAGLVIMTLVIAWQVFGRYVLNSSPPWSESLALITMLYFVLLAAAVGVYEQFHLGFRVFVTMLPKRFKTVVYLLGQVLILIFGAAMAWNGLRLIGYTESHIMPTLGISRSVAYWPFVMCGVLIIVFTLVRSIVVLRDKGANNPWN